MSLLPADQRLLQQYSQSQPQHQQQQFAPEYFQVSVPPPPTVPPNTIPLPSSPHIPAILPPSLESRLQEQFSAALRQQQHENNQNLHRLEQEHLRDMERRDAEQRSHQEALRADNRSLHDALRAVMEQQAQLTSRLLESQSPAPHTQTQPPEKNPALVVTSPAPGPQLGTASMSGGLGNPAPSKPQDPQQWPERASSCHGPRAQIDDAKLTFNGNRTQYPSFRSTMAAKIRYDGHLFQDESVRVHHVLSRLRDTAATKLDPWRKVETVLPAYFTIPMLFQELDKHFLDFEAKESALRQITQIKQNNTRLTDFLSEFDRLLLEAEGYHWEESVKITYLSNALARRFKERLVGRVRDTTLFDFQATLRRIDLDLAHLKEGSVVPPASGSPDAMAWETTPAPVSTAAATVRDPGSKAPRATFLSQEEFNRRLAAGRCTRCNSDNHFSRACRLRPPINPNRSGNGKPPAADDKKVRSAAVETPRPVVDEEISDGEVDQGKE